MITVDTTSAVTYDISKTLPINVTIDSTKLVKAFDNIYFGTKSIEEYRHTWYSINGNQFSFGSWDSTEEFGLYHFIFITNQESFDELPEKINGIKKTIELSYPEGQKIRELYKANLKGTGDWQHLLDATANHSNRIKLPDDDCDEIYIYKFIKKRILIKLGYIIGYNYKYRTDNDAHADSSRIIGFEKMFQTKVSFTLLSVARKVESKEDSLSRQNDIEYKKKEAAKF